MKASKIAMRSGPCSMRWARDRRARVN
jgi:hypothetical protein